LHDEENTMLSAPFTGRRMSLGFRCALLGIGLTLLAWFGPWDWPGWPARTVLEFVLARYAPSRADSLYKGIGMTLLIVINVGFWALLARGGLALARRRRSKG
jgi:hypothetical protein